MSDEIKVAAECLRRGELVAFPTETVYGLGADAANPDALARLFKLKGRPGDHPVIVHVATIDEILRWAAEFPDVARALAEEFWPGPLTLILKKAPDVLPQVTGGQDTIGLRIPNHPVALALLEEFKSGIAAPSANRFGKLSPTLAEHVRAEFKDEVAHVLDGGPCRVGLESTIVDLSGAEPRILRPGMILKEQIEKVLGKTFLPPHVESEGGTYCAKGATGTRAPGTLKSHYAPRTPLKVLPFADLLKEIGASKEAGKKVAVMTFAEKPDTHDAVSWTVLPPDPESCARILYLRLREMDSLGADGILVEQPPQASSFLAIRDRLTRAGAES